MTLDTQIFLPSLASEMIFNKLFSYQDLFTMILLWCYPILSIIYLISNDIKLYKEMSINSLYRKYRNISHQVRTQTRLERFLKIKELLLYLLATVLFDIFIMNYEVERWLAYIEFSHLVLWLPLVLTIVSCPYSALPPVSQERR